MGFFQRLFSNSPQARMERAELFMAKGRLNDARLELEGLDEPQAKAAYERVVGILARKNLEEAQARFSSGDYQGAQDHLELAKNFGATNEDIRQIRQSGNQLKKERQRKIMEERRKKNTLQPVKDDPIWSLPPDHPKYRYAMRIENYPKELRMRLISLGSGFADAYLEAEDGDPDCSNVSGQTTLAV